MLRCQAAEAALAVREMDLADLGRAAHLHHRTLPHGLFPLLGRRFLRLYLRSFVVGPAGVALVVTAEGMTVGYVVGTTDEAAHYAGVLRRQGLGLAVAALAAMARRPRVAVYFLRTRAVRYLRGAIRLGRAAPAGPSERASRRAVLEHVAVELEWRGAQLGTLLVGSFVERAHAAGVARIELLTRDDADGAAAFYDKLGWRRVDRLVDPHGVGWQRFASDDPDSA